MIPHSRSPRIHIHLSTYIFSAFNVGNNISFTRPLIYFSAKSLEILTTGSTERLPITKVIKHRELGHKRSVKRPKCQKTSLVWVGSNDPNDCYIVNNSHSQWWKNVWRRVTTLKEILWTKNVILGFTFNKKILKLMKCHPIPHKRIPVLAISSSNKNNQKYDHLHIETTRVSTALHAPA